MRKIAGHLMLLMALQIALPAKADDCARWNATMEEAEEGRVMIARICAQGQSGEAALYLKCAGADEFWLSYDPGSEVKLPNDDEDYEDRFVFDVDGKAVDQTLQFEAMDGVMVAGVSRSGALVRTLRSGQALSITSTKGHVSQGRFTLNGSTKALETLARRCR